LKKKVLRLIGLLLTAVSVIFVVERLVSLDTGSVTFDFSAKGIAILIGALLLQLISVFLLAVLFGSNINFVTEKKSAGIKDSLNVYIRSNLGKYIPGNVFQYIERNLFYSEHGISHADTTLISIVEIVLLLISACIITLVFGSFGIVGEVMGDMKLYLILLAVAVVTVLAVAIICVLKKKPVVKEHIKKLFKVSSIKRFIVLILMYILVFALMNMSMLVCFTYMGADTAAYGFRLIGAYTAAWICGFLVIGAPGGIGIREVVFSMMFGSDPAYGKILALGVIVRIISVIADILAYFIILPLRSKKKEETNME